MPPEGGAGAVAELQGHPVVFLVGPTASGKTAVAIALARMIGAEILSVDARQIYKQLELGTAKPTPEERKTVRHHLVDLFDPAQRVTAACFAGVYNRALRDVHGRGRRALVAGGSGLYVDACLGRLDRMPPAEPTIRAEHARLRDEPGGPALLHEQLERVDPESAGRLSPGDFQRVSRALEVHALTGTPISALQRRPGPMDLTAGPAMILLVRERADLWARIEKRAAEMVAGGLLEEVSRLMAAGYGADCPAFEAIGYTEFARVLAGELVLAEATEHFVRRTRRYAKRQMTWFRNRYRGVRTLAVPAGESAAQSAQRCYALLCASP